METKYDVVAECKEIHCKFDLKKICESEKTQYFSFKLANYSYYGPYVLNSISLEKNAESKYSLTISACSRLLVKTDAYLKNIKGDLIHIGHMTFKKDSYEPGLSDDETVHSDVFNQSDVSDLDDYYCGIDFFLDKILDNDSMKVINIVIKCEIRPKDHDFRAKDLGIKRAKNVEIPNFENMTTFCNSIIFSDMKLISSDNKVFPAHRCILAASSPIFEVMLDSKMIEGIRNEIKIDDMDGDALMDLLQYIYNEDFEITSIEKAINLLQAAEKYNMNKLKYMSVKYLDENYSHENVLEILVLAELYNESVLMKNCINYSCMNFVVLQHDKDWPKISSTLSLKVMKAFHEMKRLRDF